MDAKRPSIPDALLAEERWLARLAGALVRDPGDADDAAQDTWLAAAMRPPASADAPRAWLATVLRRRLRGVRRERERRARRERAAARPELVAATADEAAREDAARRLVAAVKRLPPPFQEAVLLHYFDGLPPAAIAARLGVPASTVRNRLARARRRLRADLEGRRGGRSALLALAFRRTEPPFRIARPLGAAAAVLLAASAALFVSLERQGPGAAARSAAAAQPPAPTVASDEAEISPRGGPAPGAPAAPRTMRRLVRVVDEATRRPAAHAEIHLAEGDLRTLHVASAAPPWGGTGLALRADPDGTAELPPACEPLLVRARDGSRTGEALVLPSDVVTTILLADGPALRAVVTDPEGRAVEGIDLVLLEKAGAVESVAGRGVTDGHGRASLCPAAGSAAGSVRVAFALPSLGDAAPAEADGTARLVARAAGSVEFLVTDPGGSPLERGGLSIAEPGAVPGQALLLPVVRGRAVAHRLPVGVPLVVEAFDADRRWVAARGAVDGPRAGEERATRRLALVAARPLVTGRAVDAAGRPLDGLLLEAREAGAPDAVPEWTRTDRDGRFLFLADASAGADLRLLLPWAAGGRKALATVPLRGGSTVEAGDVVVAFPPLLAAGRAEDPDGRPLAGAVLRVASPRAVEPESPFGLEPPEALTDADGRFELRGRAPPGPLYLLLESDGHHLPEPVPLTRGACSIRVVAHPAAAVTCRSTPGTTLQVDALDGAWSVRCIADARGRAAHFACPPGDARVRVGDGEETTLRLVAGQVHEIPTAAPAGLTISVPAAGASLFVRRDGAWARCALDEAGRARVGAAGPVEVLAVAPGRRSAEARFERDGEIELPQATPAEVRVRVLLPADARARLCADLLWLGTRETLLDDAELDPRNEPRIPEPVAEDGSVTLRASDRGLYRVRIFLLEPLADEIRIVAIDADAAPIAVDARGETVVAEALVTAAALGAARALSNGD